MTTDLFKQARESITIPQAWQMLGLQGEPKASCKSPWRDERTPSFSIYENGTKWKDHGEQLGGDVIEFIRITLGTDHAGVREWLIQHLGNAPQIPVQRTTAPKVIQWDAPHHEGEKRHHSAMVKARGLHPITVQFMAAFDLLRFSHIAGMNAFIVSDGTLRNAEIRRVNGEPWPQSGKKAYPLKGVDKSWLVGAEILRHTPDAHVMLVEGATDFLTAWDLVVRQRIADRTAPKWVPVALLGAGCKALHPECANLLRGRHVRIVPDGDEPGRAMLDHWSSLLASIGCTLDTAQMPEKTDLSDHHAELKNEPQTLFIK
jgi:hypothetical protein